MGIKPEAVLAARQLGLVAGADVDPLSGIFLDFLCSQTKETPAWDFKKTLSVSKDSDFAKVAKDVFALANLGGGYLLIGWEEKETGGFDPVGLPPDFHIDDASLQQKFNAYSNEPITLHYKEFTRVIDGDHRKFAAVFVPPSPAILRPTKDGIYLAPNNKQRTAFKASEVLIRRGTQSTVATDREVRWIEKRVRRDNYSLSLISGQPDDIEEVLHSNLFPVLRIPQVVYAAELKNSQLLPPEVRRRCPCLPHRGKVFTFEDPSTTELLNFILPSTVTTLNTDKWKAHPDNARLFIWLLKECVKSTANGRGMRAVHKFDRIYYPFWPEKGEKKITWRGLKRGAPRQVAAKMYATQFEQYIYVHPAAGIDFVRFGDSLFLELTPTRVLTWDGRRPIKDHATGSVITRLLSDCYNDSYLRDDYFWIEQLETNRGKILLARGQLEIAAEPLTATVDKGIMTDQLGTREETNTTKEESG